MCVGQEEMIVRAGVAVAVLAPKCEEWEVWGMKALFASAQP